MRNRLTDRMAAVRPQYVAGETWRCRSRGRVSQDLSDRWSYTGHINCMYVDDALECAGGEFLSHVANAILKSIV